MIFVFHIIYQFHICTKIFKRQSRTALSFVSPIHTRLALASDDRSGLQVRGHQSDEEKVGENQGNEEDVGENQGDEEEVGGRKIMERSSTKLQRRRLLRHKINNTKVELNQLIRQLQDEIEEKLEQEKEQEDSDEDVDLLPHEEIMRKGRRVRSYDEEETKQYRNGIIVNYSDHDESYHIEYKIGEEYDLVDIQTISNYCNEWEQWQNQRCDEFVGLFHSESLPDNEVITGIVYFFNTVNDEFYVSFPGYNNPFVGYLDNGELIVENPPTTKMNNNNLFGIGFRKKMDTGLFNGMITSFQDGNYNISLIGRKLQLKIHESNVKLQNGIIYILIGAMMIITISI